METKRDHWRPSDAYTKDPETQGGLPLGAEIPEPDLEFDRLGIIFDELLTRINAYENLLANSNAKAIRLPASVPSDDIRRGEEYHFLINRDTIHSMKYIAQGAYEALVDYSPLGKELARDIAKSHGKLIETPDWRLEDDESV